MALKFIRPSGFYIMDQNNQNYRYLITILEFLGQFIIIILSFDQYLKNQLGLLKF